MKYYTKQHHYYCGIDLHTKKMYVCIMNQSAEIVYHKNHIADPENLMSVIKPYIEDIVICVECIFTWYWIADFCEEHTIPFILGHAYYMKAISGAKTKNDKIDSQKIAALLRGGMIPMAYVYPQRMRATRDMFRRRIYFVRRRADLLSHIQNTNTQYHFDSIKKGIMSLTESYKSELLERFSDPVLKLMISTDINIIDSLTHQISKIEYQAMKSARHFDPLSLMLLKTIPGIGDVLALTILYEINDINRFSRVQNFASYCRVVKCQRESGGKQFGSKNTKIGNPILKWAFSEAAVHFSRYCPEFTQKLNKMQNKFGNGKTFSITAHKLARTVFYMLKKRKPFDVKTFCNEKTAKQVSLASN